MTGTPWQPTKFLRFERGFPTSMCTAEVMTDAGRAYLKAMGNPEGPHALACELVATHLARWFGLQTFDFAILRLTDADEVPFGEKGVAEPGPAFVTRAEDGHTWGGDAGELDLIENPEDMTRLVVFDSWVRNVDRQPPAGATRKPNLRNVFLSAEKVPAGRLRLLAMDHTHTFTWGRELTRRLGHMDMTEDPAVYGLFPPFLDFLSADVLESCRQKLRDVSRGVVAPFVDAIPREWDVSSEGRDALKDFLCGRAAFLAAKDLAYYQAHAPQSGSDPTAKGEAS